jgi:hypothetical protein
MNLEKISQRTPAHLRDTWPFVEKNLLLNRSVMHVLNSMEESGGEPMLVSLTESEAIFMDGSNESPKGRRTLCFDEAAWHSRKLNKPKSSVEKMAQDIGGTLLDETDCRLLQSVKSVDLKTSTWIQTPERIRQLGGALFMDSRYNDVFVYHNGAESYYESRGFRLKIHLPLTRR